MPRSLSIDIRSKQLAGGRLTISARTTKPKERDAREAAVRALIENGRIDIVERLRRRELHVASVYEAFRSGDYSKLEAVVAGTMTLGAAIDRVVARSEGGGVGGTIRNKHSLRRCFEESFDLGTPLHDIPGKDLEAFLFGPHRGKLWGSVRQEQARQMGQQAWDVAIADEAEQVQRTGGKPRLTINPWRAIKVAGRGKNRMARVAFLQRAEWRALEAANVDLPELALCALGALGGLRKGEACHLRTMVDLDMDARTIRIQPRTGAHSWRPKTPNSIRVVPMNDRLHGILARHIELGFAGRYLVRAPRTDTPMGETTASNWTCRAFELAGIKYGREGDGYTNHTLRHSFASWLAQEDVQLKKIAELIGDTVAIVDRYYAAFLPGDLDRTVRVLDRVLEG